MKRVVTGCALVYKRLPGASAQLGVKSDHQTEVIQTQMEAIQNQTVVIGSLTDAVKEMKSGMYELRLQVSQNTSGSGLKRKRTQPDHPVIVVSVHIQLIYPKKAISAAGHRTSTGGYDAAAVDNRLNFRGACPQSLMKMIRLSVS